MDGEIVIIWKIETVRWRHAIVVQEYTPYILLVQAQWTYFHLRGQRIGGWVVQDPSGSHIWCQSQYPTTSSIARLSSYSMHWRPSNAFICPQMPSALILPLHVCIGFHHWLIQPSDYRLHKWRSQLCWCISLIIEDSQGDKRESQTSGKSPTTS